MPDQTNEYDIRLSKELWIYLNKKISKCSKYLEKSGGK